MKQEIWKYELSDSGLMLGKHWQIVEIPKYFMFLDVQIQNNRICIWVRVDKDQAKERRKFMIYGTGVEITQKESIGLHEYLGTVQLKGFEWHIFDGGLEAYA